MISLSLRFVENGLFVMNDKDSNSTQLWEDVEPPKDHWVPILLFDRNKIIFDEKE